MHIEPAHCSANTLPVPKVHPKWPTPLHSQQSPRPSQNSACRAIDGDVVAVELLPEARWRGASTHLPTPAESTASNEDAEEGDADEPEGGHIAQVGGSPVGCQRRTRHADLFHFGFLPSATVHFDMP